ncbi:MAG TPA: ribonuclease HI [Clostridiales bacterium]|nr:ribonuclease HI [Clostridia bacterium]HCS73260.1 ribonuclease HI [Clostridiales bacterium]
MKQVDIFTDGACSGNPGPGGWAAILSYNEHEKELSGYEANTTNNRMELTAPIKALEALKEPCKVNIYTDSAYVSNAFNQRWVDNWLQNGWCTRKRQPVENQELWKYLLSLMEIHQVNWYKVKGHSDNEKNNRCDELATAEIKKQRDK